MEARVRLWGADLSGRSNITLSGIHFLAASVKMEDSQNCVMADCHVEYPAPWGNHVYGSGGSLNHDYGGVTDGSTGVFVSGQDNVVIMV